MCYDLSILERVGEEDDESRYPARMHEMYYSLIDSFLGPLCWCCFEDILGSRALQRMVMLSKMVNFVVLAGRLLGVAINTHSLGGG
jgi:hypothetical protein